MKTLIYTAPDGHEIKTECMDGVDDALMFQVLKDVVDRHFGRETSTDRMIREQKEFLVGLQDLRSKSA